MNNDRRKEMAEAADQMSDAYTTIQQCGEDEQNYYDEMPEGLQGSEKGDRATEVADELSCIADELNDLVSRIEECKQ